MKHLKPVAFLALAAGLLAVGRLQSAQAPAAPIVFQGPELERFLSTAKFAAMKDLGTGVTHSRKATLELGGVTKFGVFKIIDEKPVSGVQQLAGGAEAEFQDSWRTEVSAYELDKLIDLGLVPVTVQRTFERVDGSVQFWVDSIMNEKKRQETKATPPNVQAWNDQMARLMVWDNLIYNTDRNLGNILITATWQMVAIDHSRSFRPFGKMRDAKTMTRFSRSLLAKMTALTEPILKAKLDKYLTPFQIKGILTRRDAIIALSKKLVAEKGEAAVLYN